jgi:hypothetical protein
MYLIKYRRVQMRQGLKGNPRTIRLDKPLEKEIRSLLPESGMEGFSQFARHLFRLGVTAERRRQEQLALIQKQAGELVPEAAE